MERVCFRLQVRKEHLAEYVQRHKAVWPEMLQSLRETGWTNYSLFLDPKDGLLIGYLETPDLEVAKAEMAIREINTKWQSEMAPFFEALDDLAPDEGFLRLEEIFHLD